MKSSQVAELAASLAVGGITADAISDQFGGDVLAEVLGFSGGLVVGSLVTDVMRATGISDLIDEIF